MGWIALDNFFNVYFGKHVIPLETYPIWYVYMTLSLPYLRRPPAPPRPLALNLVFSPALKHDLQAVVRL